MRKELVVFLFVASSACGTAPEHSMPEGIHSLQAALTATCSAIWNAETAYSSGNTASLNGTNYQANWWTQGQSPATASGATGSGKPWTATGVCTGATSTPTAGSATPTASPTPTLTPTPAPTGGTHKGASATCSAAWNAATAYVSGNLVSKANTNYQANWWTQGQDPTVFGGAAGSGQVWLAAGPCTNGSSGTTSTAPTPVTSPTPTTVVSAPVAPGGLFFSPYKDVTISANWNTSVISTAVTGTLTPVLQAAPNVAAMTWAFATGECGAENWGGIPGAQLASANVSSWSVANKPYILSTGGAAGSFTCGSDAGFAAFIDRYASGSLQGVDFDIEAGQSQAVIDALVQRVKAAQLNSKYAKLRFSFTLATLGGNSPQSLGNMGIMVMQSIQNAGLQNYIINLMAMDYGSPTATNCTLASNGLCAMGLSATQAAINLHSHYNVPYSQIELTPMIGGNDAQDEVFTLNDVDVVSTFAKQNGLAGVHFWSFDRDKDCSPSSASPTCNSYGQAGALGFTSRFGSTSAN